MEQKIEDIPFIFLLKLLTGLKVQLDILVPDTLVFYNGRGLYHFKKQSEEPLYCGKPKDNIFSSGEIRKILTDKEYKLSRM